MRRSGGSFLWISVVCGTFYGGHAIVAGGQAPADAQRGAAKQAVPPGLSVDRIYSEPSLNGHPTPGIAWAPDSKHLSFFKELPGAAGKGERKELWLVDAASGESRLLVSGEKLETVLPTETENATQATGLARHAPAPYQWAPDGGGLLFQGPKSLAWFDLKTQT